MQLDVSQKMCGDFILEHIRGEEEKLIDQNPARTTFTKTITQTASLVCQFAAKESPIVFCAFKVHGGCIHTSTEHAESARCTQSVAHIRARA